MTDDTLLQQITAKKGELDQLRARTPDGLSGLEHTQDLELTYTSNAIDIPGLWRILGIGAAEHLLAHGQREQR
jgi:hypothetical protein